MGSRRSRALVAALALVTLAGCASAYRWDSETPGAYTVRRGDTLYNIAWRYGLDHRDIARWNGLGDGTLIVPGQRLALTGPARETSTRPQSTPAPPQAAAAVAWRWPLQGEVVARFGGERGALTGLLIGTPRGTTVNAAAGGRVVYAGAGLKSYGQLVIVKHNDAYLSAYGHNDELLVAEGDTVDRGAPIARSGLGPERRPLLHFEIRRFGSPVDPLGLLPR